MKDRRFLTVGEGIILAALVFGLIVWLVLPKKTGAQVILTRSGKELARYALDTPTSIPVEGANGFSLTLVIEDGMAHVEDSTCPDLICQHHAPISKTGEAIICLPGQISVTIEGGERLGQDAVSG